MLHRGSPGVGAPQRSSLMMFLGAGG
jgi:hypothetical protein